MFIVAPIGNTNRVTLGSTLFFCSIAAMVTGKVADEDAVPKAVNKFFKASKTTGKVGQIATSTVKSEAPHSRSANLMKNFMSKTLIK